MLNTKTLQVDSPGYWLSQCKDISKKLWLPIKTGYVGSQLNTSAGCLNFTELISWSKLTKNIAQKHNSKTITYTTTFQDTVVYDANIQRDLLKASQLKTKQSHENKTAKRLKRDPIIINNALTIPKAKLIKVVPIDINSRRIINDGYAVFRKIWNCCINAVNNGITDLSQLRNLFVINKQMSKKYRKSMQWTFRISKRTREEAVRKFIANYTTAIKNIKKSKRPYILKNGIKIAKKPIMKFKTHLDNQQTIYLSKEESIIQDNILKTFNGVKLRLLETIPNGRPSTNMTLTRINNTYYLSIPEFIQPTIKELKTKRIVSCDPGNRTFITYYSPDGEWGEIGANILNHLNKYIIKRRNIAKYKKGKSRFRALNKIDNLLRNKINDFHWKTIQWLLSNYEQIIIPRLYVAKSSKKVKYDFSILRHCEFVNRLIYKSMFYKSKQIHICKEYYTSQACTKCLSLNTIKDRTVRCKDCKFECHRDLNGARNILLKCLYK